MTKHGKAARERRGRHAAVYAAPADGDTVHCSLPP